MWTQERIKRFWEYFGFTPMANRPNHWLAPEGFNPYGVEIIKLPDITDLNCLFVLAVPRAIQKMMGELSYDRRSAVKALFRMWLANNPNGTEDYAQALAEAIEKALIERLSYKSLWN